MDDSLFEVMAGQGWFGAGGLQREANRMRVKWEIEDGDAGK